VISRGAAGEPQRQTLDGVTIHRYRPELGRLFSTSFDVSWSRRRLFRALAGRADLIVANSPLSLELADAQRCPLTYVCSGLEDVRNYGWSAGELVQRAAVAMLRDPTKRATWRRATWVDTTAERERPTLVAMGVPQEKIAAIGPGVEVARYRPLDAAACEAERRSLDPRGHRHIILSVSRFTPAKGLLETLGAFSRLARERSDVLLVMAGVQHSHRSGYFDAVRTAVHDLGLAERVAVRENVPESRMPVYYSLARVTSVFSVGYDPLPTVIIESLACGTPVVSTNFKTRRQMIEHDHTALMVPEGDARQWVSAVGRLLDDDELHARLRGAGLDTVRRNFDMDAVAARYLALWGRK
jgi:glycosyltransferase involved in cell wall biosynthesis